MDGIMSGHVSGEESSKITREIENNNSYWVYNIIKPENKRGSSK